MDIRHLDEFIILAETGNYSEAAELLYISQATLSRHIQLIEKELGVQLFERTTRKVELNKFGNILLTYARQMVMLHEQCNSVIRRNLSINAETLNIGSTRSLAQYKITDIIAKFKRIRPASEVKIHRVESTKNQTGTQRSLEELRNRKCDLAFIRDTGEDDRDLVKIPYADDFLSVLIQTKHPFSKLNSISLHALKDKDFIFLEEGSHIYKLAKKACEDSGFEPRIIFTDSKPENIVELVSKGLGTAIMMKRLATYLANPDVKTVDISPPVTSRINLCYLNKEELSEAATQFIDCAISIREMYKLRMEQLS